jgi:hypothetical protein
MAEKEEQKKMCPLSIVFNMGQLGTPGVLGGSPHVFAYCAKEKCQLWTDYWVGENQRFDCAVVVIAQQVS